MDLLTSLFVFGQVVLLAASLPLAIVAAWGYRGTPFGAALVGLPFVSVGFLASASAELLAPVVGTDLLWQLGSVVGVLGFAWLGVQLFVLLTGRRPVGR